MWMSLYCVDISAHRLDEYLQATRVAVEIDRLDVDIDLTPGVVVAGQIIDAIDIDKDGLISPAEERAYANGVVAAIFLSIDERPVRLAVSAVRFPTIAEMSQGVGTIRLRTTAPVSAAAGRHQLRIRNEHRPDLAVHLMNALVPASPNIEIIRQSRDRLQRELAVDFRVTSPALTSWPAVTGAATLALLGLIVWRRG